MVKLVLHQSRSAQTECVGAHELPGEDQVIDAHIVEGGDAAGDHRASGATIRIAGVAQVGFPVVLGYVSQRVGRRATL